jgi:hypothetical protein
MNTIPTTTKRSRVPYTVVGGSRTLTGGKLSRRLSIVLLNRGGRPFKTSVFTRLFEIGASEILSVEGPSAQYDIENLSRRYPEVRFLILAEQVTDGERVNIGIDEAKGDFVLVMWNDMEIDSGLTAKSFETIASRRIMCTVPKLSNQRREAIPVVQVPALFRSKLQVVPAVPTVDETPTIYPFDFCGIYRKEQFVLSGGYDYLLTNPYWQKLDFGFRSFMWGEKIHFRREFKLHYVSELPLDDTSIDESYKLFFLKNLAVRYNRDIGKLPFGQFIQYLFRSGGDFVSGYREYKQVAKWVNLSKYRFQKDAREVTELWEMPEE